jgi:hypothetical protein
MFLGYHRWKSCLPVSEDEEMSPQTAIVIGRMMMNQWNWGYSMRHTHILSELSHSKNSLLLVIKQVIKQSFQENAS